MFREIAKADFAEIYRGGTAKGLDPKQNWNADTCAKKAGIGIWSFQDEYISPKEWRRKTRNQSVCDKIFLILYSAKR